MRISDWSSDVCSSDLTAAYRDRSAAVLLDRDAALPRLRGDRRMFTQMVMNLLSNAIKYSPGRGEVRVAGAVRSEEHTSELQSLMRISYAVFCLQKKNTQYTDHYD